MLRCYGRYERLFAHKDFKRAITIINSVSRATKTKYAVIGGAATYLHTHNPPEDYADLDIMIDADKRGALKFIGALKHEGFRIDLLEDDPSLEDLFAITKLGIVQVDFLTNQEERKVVRGALSKQGVRVERVEPLIIEKIMRASFEDLLMAADIIINAKYDVRLTFKLAGKLANHCSLLLAKVQYIAKQVKAGKLAESVARIMLKRLSEED